MTKIESERLEIVESKVDNLIESVKEIRDALIGNDYNGDGIVDSNAIPAMVDPTDTTYYYDGVHITAAGAAEIEAVLGPTVEGFL